LSDAAPRTVTYVKQGLALRQGRVRAPWIRQRTEWCASAASRQRVWRSTGERLSPRPKLW